MALFKIYRGTKDQLPETRHDGYAYFTTDEQKLYIDVGQERYCLNADGTNKVWKDEGYVDTTQLVFDDDVINVPHGGTGVETLLKGAIIVGNDTDSVQTVSIPENSVVVGDPEAGIKSLTGTGVLQIGSDGELKFATLPLELGGTGATSAETARTNLQVYSKGEIDDRFKKSTSVAYDTELIAAQWVDNSSEGIENRNYKYEYSNESLICGTEGKVPPIVTCTSNQEEYDTIDSATATPGTGITFYTKERPKENIGIIVIDVM